MMRPGRYKRRLNPVEKPSKTAPRWRCREVILGRLAVLIVLAGVFGSSAAAQQADTEKADPEAIKNEIIRLQDEEDRALLRGDIDTLDRLWADQLLYPNDNGEVLTKTQRLAEARSRTHNFSVFRHDDLRVRIYNGNTAVVTGYSTTLKKYKGQVSRGPRRFSAVWMRLDGRWQMVAHQRTDASRQ
jgi:hypothetical protein